MKTTIRKKLGWLVRWSTIKGEFWIRFFNSYGFIVKDTTRSRLTFSERNGFVKYIKIGKYLIKAL